ncbi:aspartyl-phosphate phosphatase Spo0E family protein [Romboutsia ilealis]|uniref:Uncharacterized protein n=1 Tax=Romboutsia faecis TaxID=2764597 RepID=A0ABR7JSS5_9FIRM|nr:aspartyl-phosphate phosphatase Spo0E family protein [Romboutsia faecis]MBC5997954.1 hypothetical protein [Romboutsia faecis]MRN25648.1 aspartyl-phosphate phosphatase Spo0E family protein [Romboutsia ilealis]
MSEGIGADLRAFLEEMYQRYGHNETTVAISQILDKYMVEAQRERLANAKANN